MEKIDYLQLKTIDQVKKQRELVDGQLCRTETRLKKNYEDLVRMFDFDHILQAVSKKIVRLYGIVETALAGYDLVRGVIAKFRNRRENPCE